MAADWYSNVVLSSHWRPAGEGTTARYRLILANGSNRPLEGFRLGFSGPMRISEDAVLAGAHVVVQLANFCEIAPSAGFVLEPGKEWVVDIDKLEFPIRHWTDGVTSAFLVLQDGSTAVIRTEPTALEGSDALRRRGTAIYPVPEHPPVPVSIIPWPQSVDVSGRRTAPSGFAIEADSAIGIAAAAGFEALVTRLFPGEGLVRSVGEGGYPVRLVEGDGGPEGYAIRFSRDMVRIEAATQSGFLYGLVTLGQVLRGARLNLRSFAFPTHGSIEDSPAMRWRGCHLDVARRFFARGEVEQFLALLAWNKLNVLHWHLSDDEAWRVELQSYPELTDIGAWRGYGMAIPPLLGSGPEPSGGSYSKEDVRAIVALAASFAIDVVPEIDMPGHCYAMLQALPQLRDAGENGTYSSIQSFPNNSLNPAVETVYPVLETILHELIELFPSRYFHVGADEVPEDAWATSAAANRMRTERGVSGAAPLQAAFLTRLQEYLTAKGKVTGAWEEASHGGGIDKANCYLVGWRDTASSRALAAEGYEVVVAPGQAYYLDMANSPDWHECGAAWAGWSSVEKAYRFEPTEGWSDAERAQVMGVQACIWCEPMTDCAVFDRLVFPRLSAIAETGWSRQRDFTRFIALVGLMPNLYGCYEGH